MNTVSIKKELITWALERAGFEANDLLRQFPKIGEWVEGKSLPTLRQLETLAHRLWAPLGYFFLPAPPEEKLPIPDFRSVGDTPIEQPSPNLLDTVFSMQRRQSWYKDFIIEEGAAPLPFFGSFKISDKPENVALDMRKQLGITPAWARSIPTWEDALAELGFKVEESGILAVWNSMVGNNTSRILELEEFRGFVLPDSYAPLIFVNSADAKAAQMFTLAHELAHIWIGTGGVLNFRALKPADNHTERFCNAVAAEFLIPKDELVAAWDTVKRQSAPFAALSRQFKISPLVAARRALDAGFIKKDDFLDFYKSYMIWVNNKKAEKKAAEKPGGDFYANCDYRIGRPFAQAVARAALGGRLLYRDAYKLTGLQGATFDKYIKRVSQEGG
jgi:Zn-dependent peptidase ImmA (M78 family)